ncbi:MAG: 7,8-didemethyl-8-hydroxy-5-deazariboflavin synthase CofG [Acidimicrobiia bacterium]
MLTKDEAFRLTRFNYDEISSSACEIRDDFSKEYITYSPKVFIPLTQLCQDICSYCTFAKSPDNVESIYMSLHNVRQSCSAGKDSFCSEALFTLGESPEKRYEEAALWLSSNGYRTTVDYLVKASEVAIHEFGLLPHVNPGAISDRELRALKEVSVSQGMMLENIAGRLCEPGGPHFGSPDKTPARRLATLEAAGRVMVPFTTGILVGIGETRHEIIESLLAIRDLHLRYGHIQEVIVQNFLPKSDTPMASSYPCPENEHLWAISAARLIFENTTHIQAPPNLATSVENLVNAGIDDFGGISPVTIDYVNPEKPWPHLISFNENITKFGKKLRARASVYPEFIKKPGFISQHITKYIDAQVNASGYLKKDPINSNEDVIDLTVEESKSSTKRFSSNLPSSRSK